MNKQTKTENHLIIYFATGPNKNLQTRTRWPALVRFDDNKAIFDHRYFGDWSSTHPHGHNTPSTFHKALSPWNHGVWTHIHSISTPRDWRTYDHVEEFEVFIMFDSIIADGINIPSFRSHCDKSNQNLKQHYQSMCSELPNKHHLPEDIQGMISEWAPPQPKKPYAEAIFYHRQISLLCKKISDLRSAFSDNIINTKSKVISVSDNRALYRALVIGNNPPQYRKKLFQLYRSQRISFEKALQLNRLACQTFSAPVSSKALSTILSQPHTGPRDRFFSRPTQTVQHLKRLANQSKIHMSDIKLILAFRELRDSAKRRCKDDLWQYTKSPGAEPDSNATETSRLIQKITSVLHAAQCPPAQLRRKEPQNTTECIQPDQTEVDMTNNNTSNRSLIAPTPIATTPCNKPSSPNPHKNGPESMDDTNDITRKKTNENRKKNQSIWKRPASTAVKQNNASETPNSLYQCQL